MRAGLIEITGTSGTLALPDPNGFGGPSQLWQDGGEPDVIDAVGPECERGKRGANVLRIVTRGL